MQQPRVKRSGTLGKHSNTIQIALKGHIKSMAQSLAEINIHLIFSTQFRYAFLNDRIRPNLFYYMAALAKKQGSHVYEIGGVADHTHVLLTLPRTMILAQLVMLIKKESSKWMKREHDVTNFAWQNGYGAFSVSSSKIDFVRRYIREQEKHHQQNSFQDEMRLFLKNTRLSFDEKYLWD